MMRLHDLSVTQQIMLIALAPLACLTIAFSALHLVYASQSSAHAAHGRALAMASFLAPAAEYGVFSRDQNHLEALLQTAMMQEGVIAVAILDETGQTIAARGLPVDPVLSTAPDEPMGAHVLSRGGGRLTVASRIMSPSFGDSPHAATSLSARARPLGWVYLVMDTRPAQPVALAAGLEIGLLSLAVLAVIGALTYRLARPIGAPLARIASAVNRIAAGRHDVTVPTAEGARELQALADGFNTMARALDSAQQSLDSKIDQATAQLNFLALHDPLTGVLNRRAFERELEKAVAASRRVADHATLCFVDLDYFKRINDNCGHCTGDVALKTIATLIANCVRAEDLIFRIGGDEFAIILKSCSPDDARRIADGIRETISRHRFEHQAQHYPIGASIGLVRIDNPDSTVDGLLRAADAACYSAKQSGRNCVVEHLDT